MAVNIDHVQQRMAAVDARVDRMGEAYRQQIASALRSWGARAIADVGSLTSKKGQMLAGSYSDRDLRSSMKAGPAETARRALQSLAALYPELAQVRSSAGLTVQMSDRTKSLLNVVYRVAAQEFEDRLMIVAGDVSRVIARGMMNAQDAGEVIAEVQEIVETAITWSRTQFETALMNFAQAAMSGDSKAITDAYLYVGPIDLRIRNFCIARVGRVWSKRRIDGMNNGQMANTFLTRGGYNCRHLWLLVTDPAIAQLADTGQFASPSIEAKVRAIEAMLRKSKSGRRRSA